MLPFLTFASGIVAGIIGVKLLKNVKAPESLGSIGDKARGSLDKAQAGLRDVTVSGLSALEKSSASLRTKLTPEEPAVVEAVPLPDVAVVPAKATPRRKVTAKKQAVAATSPVDAKPESDS